MNARDGKLFRKLRPLPKRGLGRVVECALLLWAILSDPEVPAWAKAIVAVALAYLVCPFDAVPDFLPAGLADDMVLIVTTLGKISGLITKEQQARARARRRDLGL